jgi:hypothetical protein
MRPPRQEQHATPPRQPRPRLRLHGDPAATSSGPAGCPTGSSACPASGPDSGHAAHHPSHDHARGHASRQSFDHPSAGQPPGPTARGGRAGGPGDQPAGPASSFQRLTEATRPIRQPPSRAGHFQLAQPATAYPANPPVGGAQEGGQGTAQEGGQGTAAQQAVPKRRVDGLIDRRQEDKQQEDSFFVLCFKGSCIPFVHSVSSPVCP